MEIPRSATFLFELMHYLFSLDLVFLVLPRLSPRLAISTCPIHPNAAPIYIRFDTIRYDGKKSTISYIQRRIGGPGRGAIHYTLFFSTFHTFDLFPISSTYSKPPAKRRFGGSCRSRVESRLRGVPALLGDRRESQIGTSDVRFSPSNRYNTF